MSNDTLALAQTLITRRSLTPADDGCQDILIERLENSASILKNAFRRSR